MYIRAFYISSEKRLTELRQRFQSEIPLCDQGRYLFQLILTTPKDREHFLHISPEIHKVCRQSGKAFLCSEDGMEDLVAYLPVLRDAWARFKSKRKPVWEFESRILDFNQGPFIMGILNVTPDSFSDGGKYFDVSRAVDHALQMEADGAAIIDIGGESTRPGSDPVSEEEELKRTIPVIRAIRKQSKVLISIDTYKSRVAKDALAAGADMVNDISGALFDPDMIPLVRDANCPIIAMHIKGTPKHMQENPQYDDVVAEVYDYFYNLSQTFKAEGVTRFCIDPGIGFGKQLEHNLHILRDLCDFQYLNQPVLIGLSRKSMLGQVLGRAVHQRFSGTLAANLVAWENGADILRVHDVRDTADAFKMRRAIIYS